MSIRNIIITICSLLFLMIGADKFLFYLKPPCSLSESLPLIVWQVIGILQIAAGILILIPKYRKYTVGFFFVFMVVFTIIHLTQNTYDIGGSTFMAVLLGLLVWDPSFIRGKSK